MTTMPMPTTSERMEGEKKNDEIRELMRNVFSLQEKVAQVAQMAMTLSTQVATLTGEIRLTGEVQEVIQSAPLRIARGTQETAPPVATIPEPVPGPEPRRRRPRATAAQRATAPRVASVNGSNPNPILSNPTLPKPALPKSNIELALSRRPMTPAQVARATSMSVKAATDALHGLAETGRVVNIGAPDQPIWTYRPGDGIGDSVTNDELQEMIIVLLTGRWLPIRTLVAATGVRTPRVDGILTKLKRAGRLEVRKEGETGRALIYTMREKPDPKHPYLKSNKEPKPVKGKAKA